ncbi:hypothetical protein [Streptomyces sp. NBC_00102]|uniref:hypothetical protein n=1 Tax=Streptomyces sp. NBC_00102 TaxID=2975652 RepID=UPI0022522BD4|nr:hypothetical protein [Streptomyces sp. NBC_00102]MCX5401730.1 hypothetical protein [Streptomyces sp. NBC_00102]
MTDRTGNTGGSGVGRRGFLARGAGAVAGGALLGALPATAAQAADRADTDRPGSTGAEAPARPHAPGTVLLSDDFAPIAGWQRKGVVMSQSLPWETSLLQDPCLVYGQGGGPLFKLWYGSLHAVGYATSEDGLHWTKADDPVLTPTLPSETVALNQPSVVLQGGVWHMTYFGVADDGDGQIHYASASAPGGPWTKHGVVLTSTMPWEDRYIYNSSLMYDTSERVWKMWYTAGKIASAGGEPQYICYATAATPVGPWIKHPANPIMRPMNDGGWASLGVGGPNVRKLADGGYETRVVGWQADYPSRGGRLTSRDGIAWQLDRSAMEIDLGVTGGPEDSMIYRQFVVDHRGTPYMYYNAKNNRPGWNETINLAVWKERLPIVDPAKWAMTQAWSVPDGASFEVRDGAAVSLGNAPSGQPQTLQGNRRIDALDYAVSASVTPVAEALADRDSVLLARATGRDTYYYAGIASWGNKYAIGVMEGGVNTKLAGTGSSSEIAVNRTYRLRFALTGSRLDLYDDDRLVLSVVDPTLIPAASYVGLQSSNNTGRVKFAEVRVVATGAAGHH